MGSVVESIGGAIGDAFEDVAGWVGGDIIDDALGLDSLGKEVERWGEDIGQVVKVITGNYHTDMKVLTAKREAIERKQNEYNIGMDALADKMSSLIAFHEIFKLAMGNRMDEFSKGMSEELDRMIEEYERMVAQLQNEYDFVIGLTEGEFGFLGQIVGAAVMIIGGIMSDIGDILSGDADSDTWMRIGISILAIIIIIVLVISMAFGNLSAPQQIAAVLGILSALLTLDGMYANGSFLSAIMSVLDFLFNDVLQLDQWAGSDFAKFDSDHEDYAEMAAMVKTAIAIAAIITGWTSGLGEVMMKTGGEMLGISAATMEAAGPYMQAYAAYNIAATVNDVIEMNKEYENLKNMMEADLAKLNARLNSLRRKNFMKHYKDTSAFLNNQQDIIDSYVWAMTAQNMYVDPYAITPVANIRFTPDDDTRMMVFGFEDMFSDKNVPGSKEYTKHILYEMAPQ